MCAKLYVGPYVSVKVPIEKIPTYEHWCQTCNKRRGDVAFCADCGNKITLKQILVRKPLTHYTIPATVVLRYATTNYEKGVDDHAYYIYTIGNGKSDFNERQEDEDELKTFWYGAHWLLQRHATDLRHVDRDEQIKFLQKRCCVEIESICDVFGLDNVSYGWGIVETW
jgi:hypothetical protein